MIGAPVAFGQRPRRRAVVAVGVRAHDRDDAASADRPDQRLDMLGKVGPGIDDRDLPLADQIGLRAVISEGRRIVREHARDSGLELSPAFRKAHPRGPLMHDWPRQSCKMRRCHSARLLDPVRSASIKRAFPAALSMRL